MKNQNTTPEDHPLTKFVMQNPKLWFLLVLLTPSVVVLLIWIPFILLKKGKKK